MSSWVCKVFLLYKDLLSDLFLVKCRLVFYGLVFIIICICKLIQGMCYCMFNVLNIIN